MVRKICSASSVPMAAAPPPHLRVRWADPDFAILGQPTPVFVRPPEHAAKAPRPRNDRTIRLALCSGPLDCGERGNRLTIAESGLDRPVRTRIDLKISYGTSQC